MNGKKCDIFGVSLWESRSFFGQCAGAIGLKLRRRFPDIRFVVEDPNEIDLPKHGKWVILDTVRGLERCRGFRSMTSLVPATPG